jgi:type III secretion protein U
MSQGQDNPQNKTEKPTQKKLRDARKKGDITQSRDLTASVTILVFVLALGAGGQTFLSRLGRVLDSALTVDPRTLGDPGVIARLAQDLLLAAGLLSAPFIVLMIGASISASVLQVRCVVAFERVKPDLSRLNPIDGLYRMFALRNLVELLKLLIKTLLLGVIVVLLMRQMLPLLFSVRYLPVTGLLPLGTQVINSLLWSAVLGFLLFAGFDVWYQQWDYLKRQRMSKEDVRREHKEREGDPFIRGKRRQLQRELSMNTMLDKVRKASVVVVNPTHVAVALYYEPEETDLPVVVAKGEGYIAQAIRDIAEEEGIPVLRDIPLARQLLAQVPLDQYIPDDLIEPVAAVLRWVRDLPTPADS